MAYIKDSFFLFFCRCQLLNTVHTSKVHISCQIDLEISGILLIVKISTSNKMHPCMISAMNRIHFNNLFVGECDWKLLN